uniref:ORF-3 n=1 Tax=Avian adenovirus 8 (strain ATCC A-2A) TaxID=66295 RepID=Q96742_ADEG8|nr:ORF-3 [Fowl aviadenovirus 8]
MPSAASGCDRGTHSLRCGGRQLPLPQSIFTCRSLRVYDVWLLYSSSHDRVCIADRTVEENHRSSSSGASEDTVEYPSPVFCFTSIA